MIARAPEILRFMRGIKVDSNDCWIWQGSVTKDGGYGSFKTSSINGSKGKMYSAHRYSYEYFVGEIPKNLDIDHLCRVRNCVNPDHLEPVTRSENVKRAHKIKGSKTHCPRGHPYSGDNLYIAPNGSLNCRRCGKEAGRRYQERKKRG